MIYIADMYLYIQIKDDNSSNLQIRNFPTAPPCVVPSTTRASTSSGEVEGYPAIEYVLRSAHNKTFTLEVGRYPIKGMVCNGKSIYKWMMTEGITFLGANLFILVSKNRLNGHIAKYFMNIPNDFNHNLSPFRESLPNSRVFLWVTDTRERDTLYLFGGELV